jgi:hypothetical protein
MSFSELLSNAYEPENVSGSSSDPLSDIPYDLPDGTPPSIFPNFADAQDLSRQQTSELEHPQPELEQSHYSPVHAGQVVEEIEWTASSAPHLSETFPWVEKETYFLERDAFIADHFDIMKQGLLKDTNFPFKDNPEATHTAAVLLLRSNFVAKYLKANKQIETSVKINLNARRLGNEYVRAGTVPMFYLGDDYISSLGEINPNDWDKVELKSISILWNLTGLESEIRKMEIMSELQRVFKAPEDKIQNYRKKTIEEIGIANEIFMVQEMAHAFYLLNATEDKEGMRKLLEELQTYRYANINEPKALLTPEEGRAYLDSNIEKDGDIWENEFIQRYYPGITFEKDISDVSEPKSG